MRGETVRGVQYLEFEQKRSFCEYYAEGVIRCLPTVMWVYARMLPT